MKTTLAKGIKADTVICGGQPCIAGTRITTKQITRCFLDGWDIRRICEEFQDISTYHVEAALRFEFRRGQSTRHRSYGG